MKTLWLCLFLGLSSMVSAQQDDSAVKLVHLVVEDTRLIASNVRFSRFDEIRLNARERVVQRAVGDSVFVVVTTQRIIGYGIFSGFQDIKVETGEEFISVEAEDFSALLISNKRMLNFNGKSGVFGERKRT